MGNTLSPGKQTIHRPTQQPLHGRMDKVRGFISVPQGPWVGESGVRSSDSIRSQGTTGSVGINIEPHTSHWYYFIKNWELFRYYLKGIKDISHWLISRWNLMQKSNLLTGWRHLWVGATWQQLVWIVVAPGRAAVYKAELDRGAPVRTDPGCRH